MITRVGKAEVNLKSVALIWDPMPNKDTTRSNWILHVVMHDGTKLYQFFETENECRDYHTHLLIQWRNATNLPEQPALP